MLYILFISITVVFFSLCHSVKLFFITTYELCLFSSDSPPHSTGEGEKMREQWHSSFLLTDAKPQHPSLNT